MASEKIVAQNEKQVEELAAKIKYKFKSRFKKI